MATYYVDFKNGNDNAAGGTATPWKTMSKAQTAATAGDTIRLRGSATDSTTWYPTAITLSKSLTWEADTGHTPTIDGGYNRSGSSYALGNSTPGGIDLAMVKVTANDVTLDGVRIQNIGGTAVTCTGHRFLMQDCVVNMTYAAGIIVDDRPDGNTEDVVITGCTFTNTSYAWKALGGQAGRNAVMLKGCTDLVFSHNLVAYSYKEGINVDKGGLRTIVEYNTIHTVNHSHIYVNRTTECDIRGNVIYHTKRREFLGNSYTKRTAPDGIKIGDETHKNALSFANSSKQRVYNNLVIGMGTCLAVVNGTNYDTQLKQAYIGFNTFVGQVWQDANGTSRTTNVVAIADNTKGRLHQSSIFENNLIYAPDGVTHVKVTGSGGVLFRNNLWFSADGQARPTAVRNAQDKTTDPLLITPAANFNDVWPALTGDGFNVDNYRLARNSPAIGAASDMGAANALTPPTITTDLTEATRDNKDRDAGEYFDIGAIEFGGGTPVTDTVTANFTQSATGGQAPLTVTFVDTSTAGGTATVNTARILYGDGGGQNITPGSTVTYTYTAAGTYTPALVAFDTAKGLSDRKEGTAITVTAPPVDDTPGTFDVIRTAMPTAAVSKTLLFNLNDTAPALVLLWLTKATTVGAATDGALLSYGAATPTAQWAFTLNSRDGQGTSDTEKVATQSACIQAIDSGEVVGSARVGSFGTNRLTLDVTDGFPAGYLLTAVAFGGSQYHGAAGTFWLGAQDSTAKLSPGFRPELWFFGGDMPAAWDVVESDADFIMGIATPDAQQAFSWRDVDGLDTTRVRAGISTSGTAIRNSQSIARAAFSNYSANELTVYAGDLQHDFGYAALDLPDTVSAGLFEFETPLSTGNQSYSCGFEPSGLILLVSTLPTKDNTTALAPAEGFAIVAVDGSATYGLTIASARAVGTSNTKSMATDTVKVIDGSGATILEGVVTLDADGFDINWSTVAGTKRHFMALAIGEAPAIVGPIVDFAADDVRPEDGIVQFTDLTNANGSAITAWLWTFGDGNTSTEQNPEHTYNDTGRYDVSLTVTTADGSNTRTKQSYIHYILEDEWLGTYTPRTVTNSSVNRLYGTDDSSEYYGAVEHELSLDALEIDAYPEDTTSIANKPGKARLVLDKANGQLIIIWPDETTDTVSFD